MPKDITERYLECQYHLVLYLPVMETPVMAADTPTVAARRRRLADWIATHHDGTQAAFIAATKINQGELSALLRDKSFGEKRAASLEVVAGMPDGYLVRPLEPATQSQSQPPRLDPDVLRRAVELAAEIVQRPIDVMADAVLISDLHDELVLLAGEPLPTAKIIAFARKAGGLDGSRDVPSADRSDHRRRARSSKSKL